MWIGRMGRCVAPLLIMMLLVDPTAAAARPLDAAAAHAKIAARGVGRGVRVTLADGVQRKGSIARIGDTSFDLDVKENAGRVTIEYAQVTGVHRLGLSTGQKIAIGGGVLAGAIVISGLVVIRNLKGAGM